MMIDSNLPNHQPAPPFNLPDLGGVTHSLGNYRGKITILNFWSAECPWSARRDLELIPLMSKWDTQVALLPIASNANEDPELISQAAKERGLTTVLLDRDQSIANLYLAQTTPHFFVVDQNGILRYQGAFDDMTFRKRTATHHFLVEAVEALLNGRMPDPDITSTYGCTIIRHLA